MKHLFKLTLAALALASSTAQASLWLTAARAGNVNRLIEIWRKGDQDDVNERDPKKTTTALHEAAIKGSLSAVEFLVEEAGADINIGTSPINIPPLYYAVYEGHEDVVRYLIRKGANVNFKDHWEQTPLHLAAAQGNLDIVSSLTYQSEDLLLNAQDYNGNTALHIAVEQGHHLVIVHLINLGNRTAIDRTIKNNDGFTASELYTYLSGDIARF